MTRLVMLLLSAALLLPACAGETFVEYRGTALAAEMAGHDFAGDPNPGGLSPVPGAEVTLFVCSGSCDGSETGRTVTADRQGEWGPVSVTFGGGFVDHEIRIEVAADGFEPYRYATVYESTPDPTAGEAWLNVRLQSS